MDDTVSRAAATDVVSRGCQEFRGIFAECEKNLNALPAVPTCNDAVSRQAAIDYCYQLINVEHQQGSDEMNYGQERVNQTETILHHLEFMPSAQPQPEEDCDTCKHGYFGDRQCDNCRVRYPSHYEREEEHHGSD